MQVQDLIACMRLIDSDSDLIVLRIKNRLDPAYDSSQSAGYRDVALNLRIVNAETKALGVETHVAEVQLMLKPFAEIKVRCTCRPNRSVTAWQRILILCDFQSPNNPMIVTPNLARSKAESWLIRWVFGRGWQSEEGHRRYRTFRNLRGE